MTIKNHLTEIIIRQSLPFGPWHLYHNLRSCGEFETFAEAVQASEDLSTGLGGIYLSEHANDDACMVAPEERDQWKNEAQRLQDENDSLRAEIDELYPDDEEDQEEQP